MSQTPINPITCSFKPRGDSDLVPFLSLYLGSEGATEGSVPGGGVCEGRTEQSVEESERGRGDHSRSGTGAM